MIVNIIAVINATIIKVVLSRSMITATTAVIVLIIGFLSVTIEC